MAELKTDFDILFEEMAAKKRAREINSSTVATINQKVNADVAQYNKEDQPRILQTNIEMAKSIISK